MYERITVFLGRALTTRLSELKREEGQGVIEYGLALAFVAVAVAGLLAALQGDISGFISKVGADITGLPGNL